MDIDVNALHQGFLRGARRRGARIVLDAEMASLEYRRARWEAGAPQRQLRGEGRRQRRGRLVRRGRPARRRAVDRTGSKPADRLHLRPAGGLGQRCNGRSASMSTRELFFKPDAGRLMCSPADETPSAPVRRAAEDLDIAIAVDRLGKATHAGGESHCQPLGGPSKLRERPLTRHRAGRGVWRTSTGWRGQGRLRHSDLALPWRETIAALATWRATCRTICSRSGSIDPTSTRRGCSEAPAIPESASGVPAAFSDLPGADSVVPQDPRGWCAMVGASLRCRCRRAESAAGNRRNLEAPTVRWRQSRDRRQAGARRTGNAPMRAGFEAAPMVAAAASAVFTGMGVVAIRFVVTEWEPATLAFLPLHTIAAVTILPFLLFSPARAARARGRRSRLPPRCPPSSACFRGCSVPEWSHIPASRGALIFGAHAAGGDGRRCGRFVWRR